jgi:hypothetical protein
MLTLAVATGSSLPASRGREVNVWRDDRGVVCARAYVSQTACSIEWLGLARFAFRPGHSDVQAWPAPGASIAQVEDIFFRRLQPIVLQAGSWQALHASAVRTPDGVIALCGRSTSGKSTLAYALSRTGWTQVADDVLLLATDEHRVWARALPFVPRLRPDAREKLGQTHDDAPPEAPMEDDLPLRLILLLTQDAALSKPMTLEPTPRARAFSALLPHAHCFDPTDQSQTGRLVSDYLAIVEQVPVIDVRYRGGLAQLPDLVAAIIDAAGAAPDSPAKVEAGAPT